MTLILFLLACIGPARVEPLVTIETSHTAFIVPLEDSPLSSQEAIQSAEYWRDAQVAAKRIIIPVRKRSIGRGWWNYEWIPTQRVITVDRAPVTREWRDEKNKILVESIDSIGFAVGMDLTAEILEEDAPTYLYHYGSKSLAEVIDKNIRSFAVSRLSNDFTKLELGDCKIKQSEISAATFETSKAHFKERGITITNMALTDGLAYEDPSIQESINATFYADQRIATAEKEKQAADAEGEVALAKAQADAKAAQAFAIAQTAQKAVTDLEIARMEAEADMIRAKATLAMSQRWDGETPERVGEYPSFLSGFAPQDSE